MHVALVLLSFALSILPSASQAEVYPSRIVKIIVPIAAGGPLDTVARAVAQSLSDRFHQPVIVENRPGAGGNLGIQAGIASDPDGYTLMVVAGSMLTTTPSLYRKPPFNPLTDLRPISTLTRSSQTLAVHPSLPVDSLNGLIDYARKDGLNYATSGYGTPSHLTMEYLRMLADFPATPVSYRGLAPLMVDLLGGQITAGFVSTAGVISHIQRGKLKALAVSSAERSEMLPNVPSIAESGYPEFAVDSYIVMVAPAGIPDLVADMLEKEVRQAVLFPQFKQRFKAVDTTSVGSTSAETKAWMKEELSRWSKVIRAAKMEVN